MPDYLILHEDQAATSGWAVTQLVRDSEVTELATATDEQLADLGRQGWVGQEGRYTIVPWDGRRELDMVPGPVDVRPSTG